MLLSKWSVLQGVRLTDISSTAVLLICACDSKSLTELFASEMGLCLYSLLAVLENTTEKML